MTVNPEPVSPFHTCWAELLFMNTTWWPRALKEITKLNLWCNQQGKKRSCVKWHINDKLLQPYRKLVWHVRGFNPPIFPSLISIRHECSMTLLRTDFGPIPLVAKQQMYLWTVKLLFCEDHSGFLASVILIITIIIMICVVLSSCSFYWMFLLSCPCFSSARNELWDLK